MSNSPPRNQSSRRDQLGDVRRGDLRVEVVCLRTPHEVQARRSATTSATVIIGRLTLGCAFHPIVIVSF